LLVEIGLVVDQLLDDHGEPARRAQGAHTRVTEPRRGEPGLDEPGQLRERARQHARRDLLATDLEQQISRHVSPPRSKRARHAAWVISSACAATARAAASAPALTPAASA